MKYQRIKEAVPESYKNKKRITVAAVLLYLCLPAIVVIDVAAVLCNQIIFPIAGIPKVRRKDYISIFSRYKIPNMNFWYRMGCVYCSYANGVAYFYQELAMRIEFLYCPYKQKGTSKISHHRFFNDW